MAKPRKYKKGENIRLTTNFHLNEMECKCRYPDCRWTIVDLDHMEKVQALRKRLGKSIKITSGYRCEKHNAAVGGGRALFGLADVTVRLAEKSVAMDVLVSVRVVMGMLMIVRMCALMIMIMGVWVFVIVRMLVVV